MIAIDAFAADCVIGKRRRTGKAASRFTPCLSPFAWRKGQALPGRKLFAEEMLDVLGQYKAMSLGQSDKAGFDIRR